MGAAQDLTVAAARELLAGTTDLAAIREVRDNAAAAQILTRLRSTPAEAGAHYDAGEIRLWAERRAGEIRATLPRRHGIAPRFDRQEARRLRAQGLTHKEVGERLGVHGSAIGYAERNGWGDGIPGVPVSDFDDAFGIKPATGWVWERLASHSEQQFEEALAEARKQQETVTSGGLLRHLGDVYEERVEPGIYQDRWGRLTIRYERDGKSHYKKLGHSDLVRAREQLTAAANRPIHVPKAKSRTAGDALALAHRALDMTEQIDGDEGAAGHLRAAIEALTRIGPKRRATPPPRKKTMPPMPPPAEKPDTRERLRRNPPPPTPPGAIRFGIYVPRRGRGPKRIAVVEARDAEEALRVFAGRNDLWDIRQGPTPTAREGAATVKMRYDGGPMKQFSAWPLPAPVRRIR